MRRRFRIIGASAFNPLCLDMIYPNAGARIAVFTYALLDFRERAIGAVQQVGVVSIPAVIVGERDVFPQVSDFFLSQSYL